MTVTIDSEVSGIMRANIGGKVNLNVLSGDVREESQAQSEEQEEKRKKKAGKRKNFKKCVIFKKKSPANTLFTGLFLVPVAGVEPARVLAQRILSYLLHREYKRTQPLMEVANGHQKRCKHYYF